MNYLIGTFLFFIAFTTFGQVSSSDEKKILKIVGEDVIKTEASSSYLFDLSDEAISIDTSIFVLGDTTGIHSNNEYLLFRDSIQIRKDTELFSLVKSAPTTISEYEEFKSYVRDSIARMKLFYGFEEDYEAAEYVNCPKKKEGKLFGRYTVFDNDRVASFKRCGLNWNKKLSYTEMSCVPKLSDLYVPRSERFRKRRVFDERKFVYREIENLTCVQDDHFLWAKRAEHDDDEFGILSQIYPEISGKNPVVGLLGTQARAFCNWRQVNIQKEFDLAKLPFDVIVTLPTSEQLNNVGPISSFEIQSKDYTEQWKITKEEYTDFIEYVKDSTLRTFLYNEVLLDELAIKFIKSEQRYFDELALEWVELDWSDRKFNSEFFPLNFDQKIREKNWDIKDALAKYDTLNPELVYCYSTIRTRAKAKPPIMKFRKETETFYSYEPGEDKDLYKDSILERRRVFSPTHPLESNYNDGVSRIWSLDKFIAEYEIPVALEEPSFSYYSSSIIPVLTYEQALAFYNWKYPIDKFNPETDDWQDYVYPSKEQFEVIQRRESIIIPEHKVEYPTPLFRYVVHIFPKN